MCVQYLEGLSDAIVKYGGKVYEGTAAQAGPSNGVVETLDGHQVRSRMGVVLATNSPINRNLGVHSRQEAQRTYALALEVGGYVPHGILHVHGCAVCAVRAVYSAQITPCMDMQ